MAIKAVQLVAWALNPFPPLIPESQRHTEKSANEYLKYAVDATKAGTKYADFFKWAVDEGLNKNPVFFGKLTRAFREARYDKQATPI